MTLWPTLTTRRLTLRAPVAADARKIAALADDVGIGKMTTMPFPYYLSDAEGFLERVEKRDPERAALLALDHQQHGLIGMVGLDDRGGPAPELGYWLGRPYWGQGLISEATSAAVTWAHRVWGQRYLVSGHFIDNPTSGRILIKAGFLYTGVIETRACPARGCDVETRMMVWLA